MIYYFELYSVGTVILTRSKLPTNSDGYEVNKKFLLVIFLLFFAAPMTDQTVIGNTWHAFQTEFSLSW